MNVEAREALPDYMNGRLNALDQATMKAHVESCADCRAEIALIREIRDRALLTPKMDVNRIAASIQPYSGSYIAPARKQSSYARRVAAAVALIAVAGVTLISRDRQPVQSASTTVPVPAVEATVAPESPATPAVAAPDTKEVQVAALSLVGGTSELSDDDLEQLVQDLEGIEAMPDAEPTSITLPVDDIESDNDQ